MGKSEGNSGKGVIRLLSIILGLLIGWPGALEMGVEGWLGAVERGD